MAKITSSIPIKFNGIKIHNDLEGLNDGDYIHLTELEKQKFDTLPNSFVTKTSDLLNDGENGTTRFVEEDELGETAFTNDYNDLDNLPIIPTVLTNHSELNLDDGTNPHGTTKADVGLGNVDNTSDVNKPISIATQNALNLKANARWLGIDDVNSGAGVTGVTIETLDKTYHLLPNTLVNGHLDFSFYSIRETGSALLHQVVVRVNNVNNFATATELFRISTGGNFSPHLRAQRKFTLKDNLIRDANLGANPNVIGGTAATGISVPFNLSGNIYIFFSTIPGATNQIIKYDSIQIKQF